MSAKTLSEEYPVHWLVWHNESSDLDKYLTKQESNLNNKIVESKDPRGRTPLLLSVTLGHLESTKVLLRHGASANAEKDYWSALQETTCTGDPEHVQIVLQHRDHQRLTNRTHGIPDLLERLQDAPDFYVEMKWEFTSWVPLVSRMCPSDTYKVYKSGSNVRIDTTLLGFDNTNWQRGNISYVFRGKANKATVMEIDHDSRQVYSETVQVVLSAPEASLLKPSVDQVAVRLTSPVNTTYIDTDKIAFERNKSGIWGWRSDKVDTINGFECKVFSATNVELVTKTRTEHLTEKDKAKSRKNSGILKSPIESFLTTTEEQSKVHAAVNGEEYSTSMNPCDIKPEEYFNSLIDLQGRDIGRPKDQTTKIQKFKANLSLCDDYPLSLQEQVLPVINLMAQTNAHFQKLKDFITLQLPAGFPVKIEIPLFHVLNAKITFGNINAVDTPVKNVVTSNNEGNVVCNLDESIFDSPVGYGITGVAGGDFGHTRVRDEDDELLQFAIQQSLLEAGTENDEVTFWEALNKGNPKEAPPITSRPLPPVYDWQAEEEQQLQRALELSLMSQSQDSEADYPEENTITPAPVNHVNAMDDQLRFALEMSQQNLSESQKQQQQEDNELQRILQLSMTDK